MEVAQKIILLWAVLFLTLPAVCAVQLAYSTGGSGDTLHWNNNDDGIASYTIPSGENWVIDHFYNRVIDSQGGGGDTMSIACYLKNSTGDTIASGGCSIGNSPSGVEDHWNGISGLSLNLTGPETLTMTWDVTGSTVTPMYMTLVSDSIDITGTNYTLPPNPLGGGTAVEGALNDLSEDGSHFSVVSEAWDIGENKTKNITALNASNDAYLVVRAYQNTNLSIWLNGSLLGSIPANDTSTADWRVFAFYIAAANVSNVNEFNFTAPSSNTEITYVDYIGLMDTAQTDRIAGNGTLLGVFGNESEPSDPLTDVFLVVQNGTTDIVRDNDLVNNNSFADVGYGTLIGVYVVPNVDENSTIYLAGNASSGNYLSSNTTVEIDSFVPIVNSVTTDTDALALKQLYNITVAVSDINVSWVEASVNDTSFAALNLTLIAPNTWRGSVNYTAAFTKNISIKAVDSTGKQALSYVEVRASTGNVTVGDAEANSSWGYAWRLLNVTSSEVRYNLPLFRNVTVEGIGTAYIDELNVSYGFVDQNATAILIENSTHTTDAWSFANESTSITWRADAWNNSNGSATFHNILQYTLTEALMVQYKDLGGLNQRTWYANLTKANQSRENISLAIPIRTAYNGSTSSLLVYICVLGLNWSDNSCTDWSDITSTVYSQSTQTYHWGTSNDQYPTIDANGDGNKDTLIFKVPSIAANGEVMFRLDVASGTAETSWSSSLAECEDGVDNDGDGLIDFGEDPDCTSSSDDSEATASSGGGSSGGSGAGASADLSNELVCEVTAVPLKLTFREPGIQKVTLENKGTRSFSPSVAFSGTLESFLSVSNSVVVLPASKQEFGVTYVSGPFTLGTGLLTLSDPDCGDIEITITSTSLPEAISIIQQFFEEGITKFLSLQVFTYDQARLRETWSFINVGIVLGLSFLLWLGIFVFKLKNALMDRRVLLFVFWLGFAVTLSFISTVVVVALLRMI